MAVANYLSVDGQVYGHSVDGDPSKTTYYTLNALGSVVATTDNKGNVLNTYEYKPFSGEVLQKTVSAPDPRFMWNGSHGYRTTNLPQQQFLTHYVRARHYQGMTAAWTTQDPLWPQEPAYRYVENMVTRSIDSSGMNSCSSARTIACLPDIHPGQGASCYPGCTLLITCVVAESSAVATLGLPARAPAVAPIGTLTIRIVYLVKYVGDICPPDYRINSTTSVSFRTGQRTSNYWDGWCTPEAGPLPPSNSIDGQYYLHTRCWPGDETGMRLGDEHFKFRIGTANNNNPTWTVTGCGGNVFRSAFLVHPDGDLNGTLGCIGLQSEGGSKTIRSCLQNAALFGCGKIPLTVTYTES